MSKTAGVFSMPRASFSRLSHCRRLRPLARLRSTRPMAHLRRARELRASARASGARATSPSLRASRPIPFIAPSANGSARRNLAPRPPAMTRQPRSYLPLRWRQPDHARAKRHRVFRAASPVAGPQRERRRAPAARRGESGVPARLRHRLALAEGGKKSPDGSAHTVTYRGRACNCQAGKVDEGTVLTTLFFRRAC